jgi:hypothetical protein
MDDTVGINSARSTVTVYLQEHYQRGNATTTAVDIVQSELATEVDDATRFQRPNEKAHLSWILDSIAASHTAEDSHPEVWVELLIRSRQLCPTRTLTWLGLLLRDRLDVCD